jgi:transposase
MIPSGVEIFLGLEPIDLRWGFERLSGIALERIGRASRSGALFVFFGKRRSALKILFFDGSGLCLFYKRLDRGTFRVPQALHAQATSIECNRCTDPILVETIRPPQDGGHGEGDRRDLGAACRSVESERAVVGGVQPRA